MKKTLVLISTIFSFLTTPVFAKDWDFKKAKVEDHYETIVIETPHQKKICKEIQVEKEGSMNTEGAIIGGIIGGVIGNQIGKGGGKAGATGVGAITGAIIGGKSGDKEYSTRTQCKYITEYIKEHQTRYSHSTITFWHEGREHILKFSR